MTKTIIFMVLFTLIGISKAEELSNSVIEADLDDMASTMPPEPIVNPETQVLQFSNITMAIITGRFAAASLQPGMQESGQQVVIEAEAGFGMCEKNFRLNHLIWQYKVCAATQLRISLAAIRALQMASQQPVVASPA